MDLTPLEPSGASDDDSEGSTKSVAGRRWRVALTLVLAVQVAMVAGVIAYLRSMDRELDQLAQAVADDGSRATQGRLLVSNPCPTTVTASVADSAGRELWKGELAVGVSASPLLASSVDSTSRVTVMTDSGWIDFELGHWVEAGVAVIPAIACSASGQ